MLPTQPTLNLGWVLLIAGLALAAVAVVLLALLARKKKRQEAPAEEKPAPAPQPPAAPQEEPPAPQGFTEPYTPGYVTLDGVDEEDAAVLMAITAYKTGRTPETLDFKSIRLVEE